jgi:hypothetical protein
LALILFPRRDPLYEDFERWPKSGQDDKDDAKHTEGMNGPEYGRWYLDKGRYAPNRRKEQSDE